MGKEFTGVWTPIAIYLHKDLSPADKYILSDIANLCSSGDVYFKSNKTIGNEVGVSVPTVTRSIKKLTALKLISVRLDGRIRLIKMMSTLIKMITLPNQNDYSASSKRLDSIQVKEQHKKHISITPLKKDKKLTLPWTTDEFRSAWDIWVDERKEKKLKKYTFRGEQAALHNLQKLSGGDEVIAIKIINQSITHGYQGLFKLKQDYSKKQLPKLDVDQALRWASGNR